jgi:hypothetical protein
MDREELRQRLDQLLKQRPFRPFRLVLQAGEPVDVRFPNINLLGMAHITVGLVRAKNPEPDPPYDSTVTVLFKLIKGIEPLPSQEIAAAS